MCVNKNRISKSIVARRAARNDFINSNPSHVVARSRIFGEERESLSSRKADPFVTRTNRVCFAVSFASVCIAFPVSRRRVSSRQGISVCCSFSIDRDRTPCDRMIRARKFDFARLSDAPHNVAPRLNNHLPGEYSVIS